MVVNLHPYVLNNSVQYDDQPRTRSLDSLDTSALPEWLYSNVGFFFLFALLNSLGLRGLPNTSSPSHSMTSKGSNNAFFHHPLPPPHITNRIQEAISVPPTEDMPSLALRKNTNYASVLPRILGSSRQNQKT